MTTRNRLLLIAIGAVSLLGPPGWSPLTAQPLPIEVAECQDFFGSIRQAELEQVMACVESKPDYVFKNTDEGLTPLMLAAQYGASEIVSFLLQSGADVNTQDPRGLTALHYAAQRGSLISAKELISNGAAINAPSMRGTLPVHFAALSGNLDLVKYFESHYANLDLPGENNSSIILWAAMSGNIELFKYLEKKEFNIYLSDDDGDGVLQWAAAGSSPAMLDFLANEKQFNLWERNKKGQWPIEIALRFQQVEQLSYFLKHGYLLEETNSLGESWLHLAARSGCTVTTRFLLEKGVNPNTINSEGISPLAYAAGTGNLELVKLLVNYQAQINPQTSSADPFPVFASTPLHFAALSGPAVVNYLLDHGAAVDVINAQGQTPLHFAVRGTSKAIVEALVKAGADVNARDKDGLTPLHDAVKQKHLELVTLMLQYPVDVNIKDNSGKTPAHYAAIMGQPELISLLESHQADLTLKDEKGNSPLYYANYYGHVNTARALLKAGAQEEVMVFDDLCHKPMQKGEATVWYLNHSGFAVRTAKHILIFDYWQPDTVVDNPCVNNGHICAEGLQDQQVIVFVSHAHRDHFDPQIFNWAKNVPSINYVLGFEYEAPVDYTYIEPQNTKKVGGVKITPITSTDSGQGFFVEVDGVTVFHPGDHANFSKQLAAEFTNEIDFLDELNRPVDIAFCPVTGCRFPDKEALLQGNYYMAQKLHPVVVIPMHAGSQEIRCKEFAERAQEKLPEIYFQYLMNKGDRFYYASSSMSWVE